jgi:hypothetical protein
MNSDATAALFIMLGQDATRVLRSVPDLVPPQSMLLSSKFDLAAVMPQAVREAVVASETYKLFFIFEGYLREFVVDVLSKDPAVTWWDKLPKDVQDEITKLEETEEVKGWMAVGSRDKSSLMTYPQLLRVIDHAWKEGFEEIVRDKALIQEARLIAHLRNTICHMKSIPDEETSRVKQVMRDWFRVVAP